jgi:TldD protein
MKPMTVTVSPPPILDTAGVDRDRALSHLTAAVNGADDGELYLEHSESESLVFDDGRLKSASYDVGEGFGLRVVTGETTGYAHASEVSEAAIARAAASAAAVKRGYAGTADAGPRGTNARLYGEDDVVAHPPFATKAELLMEIDAYARALDPRVVQVSASIAGERRTVEILRADGRLLRDVRPLVRLNVSVTVEREGRARQAVRARADEPGSRPGFSRNAGKLRPARRCGWPWSISTPCLRPPARWTWCWARLERRAAARGGGPRAGGDFNRKGTSAFAGRMGQRVAAPGVTVVDDGTVPAARLADHRRRGHAHQPHGADRGRHPGRLHARPPERAADGPPPTGNGRRSPTPHAPDPMTNTVMLGGPTRWPTC